MVDYSLHSDVGLQRSHNEDVYFMDEELGLFLVADGIGGRASGEVAASLAVETVYQELSALSSLKGSGDKEEPPAQGFSSQGQGLLASFQAANEKIFQAAQKNPAHQGMGTTLVATWVLSSSVVLGHIGDSRIYLIRGGEIEQIFEDHSLVQEQLSRGIITPEEAQNSQFKNIITRALGVDKSVEPDIEELKVLNDDFIILCSDGLTDLVEDHEILPAVLENSENLDLACEELIALANSRGGKDNITVGIINLKEEASGIKGFLRKILP